MAAGNQQGWRVSRLKSCDEFIQLFAITGSQQDSFPGRRPDRRLGDRQSASRNWEHKRDFFDSRFRPFSLLSLTVIYALIILFNPWEATFGNQRMVIPLLTHAFVWAILLFKDTDYYPTHMRTLSRTILTLGLIFSLNLDVRTWVYHGDSLEERSVADIATLVKLSGRSHRARVCILNENYWEAVARFAGPALYAHLIVNPKQQTIAEACDLIIMRSGFTFASNNAFERHSDYQLLGRSYVAYRRSGSSDGTQRSPSSH